MKRLEEKMQIKEMNFLLDQSRAWWLQNKKSIILLFVGNGGALQSVVRRILAVETPLCPSITIIINTLIKC